MAVDGISGFQNTATAIAERRARSRQYGIVVGLVALLIVLGGAGYMIYLGRTLAPLPPLPVGPPGAQLLGKASGADMLEGNFVLSTALYRSSQSPSQVVAFYRALLKSRLNQVGGFGEHATSTLPSRSPDALQHVPPLFQSPTKEDSRAGDYVYTEYNIDQSDIGIAIDARFPHGPTLVYIEMLTQPN